jgi:hypothetical protein
MDCVSPVTGLMIGLLISGGLMVARALLGWAMGMKGRDLWVDPRRWPPGALLWERVPALCLAGGFSCALFAGMAYASAYLNIVERTELRRISGRVEAVSRKKIYKGGPQLRMVVREANRQRHLVQDDLTSAVPRLRTLRVGDTVEALAYPGSDLDQLWELRRGDDTLLAYEETRRWFEEEAQRLRPTAHVLAALASLLVGVSTLLLLARTVRRRSRRATPWRLPHESAAPAAARTTDSLSAA